MNERSVFISLLDDKVGDYPLHSTLGNPFPRQDIQVGHTSYTELVIFGPIFIFFYSLWFYMIPAIPF